jgi:phosphoserine phosphatase RsbU/P
MAPQDKPAGRILTVDDEPAVLSVIDRHLRLQGFESCTALNGADAQTLLKRDGIDVALIDLSMPGISGFELIDWIRRECPEMIYMVLSGSQRMEDAIQSLQQGAFDFITKPVTEWNVFIEQIRRALEYQRLQRHNTRLLCEISEKNIELENRLGQLESAHRQLRAQSHAVNEDLERAQRIQQALLPGRLPFHERISFHARYRPENKVGGDFFDIFQHGDRHITVYLADTAGHGVSAALITVFLKHAMDALTAGDTPPDPGRLLRGMNARIFQEPFGHDLFISMTCFVLDTLSGALRYASAGHPPMLLRRNGETIEPVRTSAPALGINPEVKYSAGSLTLDPDDVLVMHTDGITDVHNAGGDYFGSERLSEIILEQGEDLEALADAIEERLMAFSGCVPFPDDITLLVLKRAPQAGALIDACRQPEGIAREEECFSDSTLLVSAEKGRTFIQVCGEGSWRESRHILLLHQQARERGDRQLIFDFAACTHLDSTFLGILHNLCGVSGKEDGVRIQLQRLPRHVLKLISELGLTQVLLHFRSRPLHLPEDMEAVEKMTLSHDEMQRLLLEAHEALVAACPENEARFSGVLNVLRKQKGAGEAPEKP